MKVIHIILEKDVGLILLYNSLVYTALYDVTATIPSLFAEIYAFNDLLIRLAFILFGVGCAVASILCGKFMDYNYKRVAKAAGITIDRKRRDDMKDCPIEKAQIQVIWQLLYTGIATICVIAGFWRGKRTWRAPDLANHHGNYVSRVHSTS